MPGVLYGKGKQSYAICVAERELRRALTGDSGLHAILDVVLEGQKTTHASILKDYQRDRSAARHAHRPPGGAGSTSRSRRRSSSSSSAPRTRRASSEGGVLSQVTREIQVEALPMEIPDRLDARRLGDGDRRHAPPERPADPRGRHVPRRSRDGARHGRAADPRRGARGGARGGRGGRARGRPGEEQPEGAAEGEALRAPTRLGSGGEPGTAEG